MFVIIQQVLVTWVFGCSTVRHIHKEEPERHRETTEKARERERRQRERERGERRQERQERERRGRTRNLEHEGPLGIAEMRGDGGVFQQGPRKGVQTRIRHITTNPQARICRTLQQQ